jgi:hypothetical protein
MIHVRQGFKKWNYEKKNTANQRPG